MSSTTKLTTEQFAAARLQLEEAAAAEEKATTDIILFEAKRDELAYELIQKSRATRQIGEPLLTLGEAQAQATKQLTATPPESSAPGVEFTPQPTEPAAGVNPEKKSKKPAQE